MENLSIVHIIYRFNNVVARRLLNSSLIPNNCYSTRTIRVRVTNCSIRRTDIITAAIAVTDWPNSVVVSNRTEPRNCVKPKCSVYGRKFGNSRHLLKHVVHVRVY